VYPHNSDIVGVDCIWNSRVVWFLIGFNREHPPRFYFDLIKLA
jgi:hypothetical protein